MRKAKEKYTVTRLDVLTAARSMLNVRFLHQGRDENGLDCVGFLVLLGKKIKYPEIFDLGDYRRTPKPATMREMLEKNLDEIPLDEAQPGDIFWMRLHGIKPRHTALFYSNETDAAKGIEPTIIHADRNGVQIKPLSDYPKEWFVAAFRIRGIA